MLKEKIMYLNSKIKEKISELGLKKLLITLFILIIVSINVGMNIFSFYEGKKEININENNINKEFIENDDSKNEKNGENFSIEKEKVDSNKKIRVYVSGAVVSPGVITIKDGSILDDALKLLGGTLKGADLDRINLALKLEDSQHYIIPFKGQNILINGEKNVDNNNRSESTQSNSSKISINTDEESKLTEIPVVGKSTAKKILDWRKKNGNFKNIEDIKKVNGIGEKKFENMKEYISI